MTKRNISDHSVTELQQAILDFIWTNGSATADQVRAALLPKHPLKDSSVRTLLRRLEQRGLLSHSLDAKTFVYRVEVAPASIAAHAVRNIIERFCSGSVEQFLVGMVDQNVLPAAEIHRLAKKIKK